MIYRTNKIQNLSLVSPTMHLGTHKKAVKKLLIAVFWAAMKESESIKRQPTNEGCIFFYLVSVAEDVPPAILRGARHPPAWFLPILAIDKSEAIALIRRGIRARAPKAQPHGARAVRSVARLDARQQRGPVRAGVAHRGVALWHAGRLRQQRGRRRHRERALLALSLSLAVLPRLLLGRGWRKLAAARERDGAEPAAVGRLAVRAGLQGRVGVAAAGGGEQACGEVGEVAEEGCREGSWEVRSVVRGRVVGWLGEGYRIRRRRAVRQSMHELAR